MSDGKNTEKVRSFWLGLLVTPALYIGAAGGIIGGYVLGRVLG